MELDVFIGSKNADRMLLISAFQQMVLNSDYREEFLEKGRTSIRPEFGDTFFQKICFNTKILFRIGCYISVLSFSSLLIKRLFQIYNISKHIVGNSVFYKIMALFMTLRNLAYVISIGAGFIGLYCFMMGIVITVSEHIIQKHMAGNTRILSNLQKYHDWWTTDEGEYFYRERTEGENKGVTTFAIKTCSAFCIEHLESMPDHEYSNRSLIHVDDPKMMEWAALKVLQDQESSLERETEFCDKCCRNIELAINIYSV